MSVGDRRRGGPESGRNTGIISLERVEAGIIERLKAKLEQYRSRDTKSSERSRIDTAFKLTILEILLDQGYVLREALKDQLLRQYGGNTPENEIFFANVFAVIKNYVEESGAKVLKGGGF